MFTENEYSSLKIEAFSENLNFPSLFQFSLDFKRETSLFHFTVTDTLGNECRGSGGFVLPCWWEDSLDHVVASQTMNSGFDQNQTEFAVDVLTVTFQMLTHADGALDEEIKILWDVWF